MQEFISLYNEHKHEIESFLVETMRKNGQLMHEDFLEIRKFFNILDSLELIYITDKTYNQVSPNIFKNKAVDAAKGRNREYLTSRVQIIEDDVSISGAYISSATGEPCVTVMFFCEQQYYFFDFNLTALLSHFG